MDCRGHITEEWQGADCEALTGIAVGFVMPASAGSAVAASLLGQAGGHYGVGKEITVPCNDDFWAAVGADLGACGGHAVGKYIRPIRFDIIVRSLSAPGMSKATSDTLGAIGEGIGAGIGESLGQKLKVQLKLPQ